jgi:predicted transcriptional regulator
VSESTITRTMKSLENKGFIKRNTKSVKGGKERHITVDFSRITTVKMTVDRNTQASK